ncbi:MAG: hypothetical protein HY904_00205 [Deltaproteobacteria bacterium]|nr:hypothetical protein [Deltaproteobacteria bacterium]
MPLIALFLAVGLFPAAGGAEACPQMVSAPDASRRAVALGFLASRAWLELKLPAARDRDALKELRRRRRSLDRRTEALQLGTVFSVSEMALMRRDLGGWEHEQVTTGSWAMEGAGTLVWVLGTGSPPSWAGPQSIESALRDIMPEGAAETLVKKPRLRARAEVGRFLEEARLFQWRIDREEQRRKSGAQPGDKLPDDVTSRVRAARAGGITTREAGGDLLSGTTPVGRLDARALRILGETARARVEALQWACGTH